MNFTRLLLRNLFYHWRGNGAVLLGVAVGTAVLTGALLVGDSLRGSLGDLTEEQLEGVTNALVAPRFFREELFDGDRNSGDELVILLQGSAVSSPADQNALPRRVGHIQVIGVKWNRWPLSTARVHSLDSTENEYFSVPIQKNEVALNEPLAHELRVNVGDQVVLHVQRASGVPRETLLGRRDAEHVLAGIPLKVGAIIPDGNPGSRFNLNPSPAPPRNAFLLLPDLQSALGLQDRVNTVLTRRAQEETPEWLHKHLTLDDFGLVVLDPATRFARLDRNRDGKLSLSEWKGRTPRIVAMAPTPNPDNVISRQAFMDYYNRRGYLSLESRQVYLEPAVVRAAVDAARNARLRSAPTLVYLANRISDAKNSIPYSIVAALDPKEQAPLGTFLPPGISGLADDEIVLTDWEQSPLKNTPLGSTITLTYFAPDAPGPPQERKAEFRLVGRIPLDGVADDPDLAPEFPGITDKTSPGDWDPPSSFDRADIDATMKGIHERYWTNFRTTPKAYVSLSKGQQLWGSRFGNVTSVRLAPMTGPGVEADRRSLEEAAADFRKQLLERLKPEDAGLVFDPVRERALQASAGGNDFGGLFLGFSFFLIVAALLLVGLLFRLNLDRRAPEIGLLLATGYRRRTVFLLLLAEGAWLAAVGGLVGLALAILYSRLLLDLLRTLWPGGLESSFLRPFVTFQSLAIGFVSAFAVSVLTIAWAMRTLRKVAPTALLAGETTPAVEVTITGRRRLWSAWVALGFAVLSLVHIPIGYYRHGTELQAVTFFGSGLFLLIAALAATWAWMRSTRHARVGGHGPAALAKLGVRNAARHPLRSLLTAGLLASASFLLVAVESFRRHADDDFLAKNAGSGGYALVAESDVPIYQDLNSDQGQAEISHALERRLRNKDKLKEAQALLQEAKYQQFRVRAGDDASCLNLYQPRKPRLLGVPPSLVQRGGFHFAGSLADSAEAKANPWLLLEQPLDDGAIPVMGEVNTVKWMLKSGLGEDIPATDERGNPVKLRVVALLSDSVFQSGLLMSNDNFLKLYPATEGYNFFLVETPPGRADEVKADLEGALGDRGLDVTPSARRLEAYLAVENMYLSTFQALGGLGLLLGTFGLAVVLLRSIWERRGELALLRALGYRHRALSWLLLSENGFLLLLGLGIGAATALLAVAPHLAGGQGAIPWPELIGMLAVVFLVGLLTAAIALAATLRAPLVPALRRE